MRCRKVVLSLLAVITVAISVVADESICQDSSIEFNICQFVGSNWTEVYPAKDSLESKQGWAIPHLIALLERNEYIKLSNIADLIYPGSEMFYGHGWIIDYDIDWLSVRAGWVLEDITFQDFGFSEYNINHDDLLAAAILGYRNIPLHEVVPIDVPVNDRKQQREKAIKKCKDWWVQNHDDWDRLSALLNALNSGQSTRIHKALQWVRHGESPMDGLTKEVYTSRIFPLIKRLTESSDSLVAIQAGHLVQNDTDNEWYWYTLKQD